MTSPTRVALLQLCATTDVKSNLACAERLVREARDGGAAMALLPEAYAYIGSHAGKVDILEPVCARQPGSSPILERFCALGAELRMEIVLGGHHETAQSPERCYNTAVHIGADGAVRAAYRKIHLFDVKLDDGTELRESARTLPGTDVVVTETPFGRLGLTVCYDIRFPYLYQALVDRGAVAVCVPSAFTATTGAAHWHTLLRARAIECQCYVLAPAQHGRHNDSRRSYGHSLVVDPWGEVVAELADGDGVLFADIDPGRVADVRRQLPSLEHRVCLDV
ncbi:MAG: carbon-nitrogen hydrolase family protein [Pseudomonadales bacterium]